MNKKEQILKAIECFKQERCLGDECPYFKTPLGCNDVLKDVYEYIHSLLEENNNLREALDIAIGCIGDCEYSLTKISNSRVEAAVDDWERYSTYNNIDELLRNKEKEQ